MIVLPVSDKDALAESVNYLETKTYISKPDVREKLINCLFHHSHFQQLAPQYHHRKYISNYISKMIDNITYKMFKKGKAIYHKGEESPLRIYFILTGKVNFYRSSTEQDLAQQTYWKTENDKRMLLIEPPQPLITNQNESPGKRQFKPSNTVRIAPSAIKIDTETQSSSDTASKLGSPTSLLANTQEMNQILKFYENDEDSNLLQIQKSNMTQYFKGNFCSLKKVNDIKAGDSFGDLKQTGQSTLLDQTAIAAQDTAIIYLSTNKYSQIFSGLFTQFNFILQILSNQLPSVQQEILVELVYNAQQCTLEQPYSQIYNEDEEVNGIYIIKSGIVELKTSISNLVQENDDKERNKQPTVPFLKKSVSTNNFYPLNKNINSTFHLTTKSKPSSQIMMNSNYNQQFNDTIRTDATMSCQNININDQKSDDKKIDSLRSGYFFGYEDFFLSEQRTITAENSTQNTIIYFIDQKHMQNPILLKELRSIAGLKVDSLGLKQDSNYKKSLKFSHSNSVPSFLQTSNISSQFNTSLNQNLQISFNDTNIESQVKLNQTPQSTSNHVKNTIDNKFTQLNFETRALNSRIQQQIYGGINIDEHKQQDVRRYSPQNRELTLNNINNNYNNQEGVQSATSRRKILFQNEDNVGASIDNSMTPNKNYQIHPSRVVNNSQEPPRLTEEEITTRKKSTDCFEVDGVVKCKLNQFPLMQTLLQRSYIIDPLNKAQSIKINPIRTVGAQNNHAGLNIFYNAEKQNPSVPNPFPEKLNTLNLFNNNINNLVKEQPNNSNNNNVQKNNTFHIQFNLNSNYQGTQQKTKIPLSNLEQKHEQVNFRNELQDILENKQKINLKSENTIAYNIYNNQSANEKSVHSLSPNLLKSQVMAIKKTSLREQQTQAPNLHQNLNETIKINNFSENVENLKSQMNLGQFNLENFHNQKDEEIKHDQIFEALLQRNMRPQTGITRSSTLSHLNKLPSSNFY